MEENIYYSNVRQQTWQMRESQNPLHCPNHTNLAYL